MATKAHCAFCLESLASSFDRSQPLSLAQVEQLWEDYTNPSSKSSDNTSGGAVVEDEDEDDAEMIDVETAPKPAAISRLLDRATDTSPANNSDSSLPSSKSGRSNEAGSVTPASSMSSGSSGSVSSKQKGKYEDFPLFVTWNTVSGRSGHKNLRGCIGTFEALPLEKGLRSYALTSAFEDTRFSPIPRTLLPNLSVHVTLLTNFSSPTRDPLDWTLGTHGIRISFHVSSRRYGATYLPDVAKEQGWTKEETMTSLMRKGGWNGSSSSWERVWREGRGELVRYEGKAVGLGYAEWKSWRDWVEEKGIAK